MRTRQSRIFGFSIAFVAFCLGMTFALCNPFRRYEVFLRLLLPALPVAVVGAFILRPLAGSLLPASPSADEAMTVQVSESRPTTGINPMKCLLAGVIAAFILADAGLILNEYMDSSPATSLAATALGRHVSYGRHGSRHYYATIVCPVSTYLPWKFSDEENITLSTREYDIVSPDRTVITLHTHKGFLGFPWYERHIQLSTP